MEKQKKKNEMSILRSPKNLSYKKKNFVLVKHREWRRCDNVFL